MNDKEQALRTRTPYLPFLTQAIQIIQKHHPECADQIKYCCTIKPKNEQLFKRNSGRLRN